MHMSTMTSEGSIPTWDLGDRLGKSLKHAGVKVGEMAEYLGVSRNTVGNYTNGRTAPDRRTLLLWAMRTGVPFEWLQTGAADDGHTPDGGITVEYRRPLVSLAA